jgi:hypothetical protein
MSEGRHLSSLQLDELALGALPQAEEAAARAHLASCGRCQADDAALASSRAHFSAAVLPKTMGAVRRRADAESGFWQRRRTWLVGLTVACGAAAALLIGIRRPATDEDLLAKGGGAPLAAFFKRGDRVAQVVAGQPLRAGDSVRLVVQTQAKRHVAVLSADVSGHVTRWFPQQGKQSGELAAHARAELPGAIVLDASPGPERLFAVFADSPIDLPPLEKKLFELGRAGPEAVRRTERLNIIGADQATRLIEKEPK